VLCANASMSRVCVAQWASEDELVLATPSPPESDVSPSPARTHGLGFGRLLAEALRRVPPGSTLTILSAACSMALYDHDPRRHHALIGRSRPGRVGRYMTPSQSHDSQCVSCVPWSWYLFHGWVRLPAYRNVDTRIEDDAFMPRAHTMTCPHARMFSQTGVLRERRARLKSVDIATAQGRVPSAVDKNGGT